MVNPVPVIRRDAAARQRTGTRESGGSRGAFDAELRGWPVQLATSWILAQIADGTPIAEPDTGPGGIYSRLADLGHAPAQFTEEVRVRVPDDDEVTALSIDPDHRIYTITRVAADRAGRPVEVNTIVMPTHQWTLAYTWQAE
jgi:GntR family transcriptional regulator